MDNTLNAQLLAAVTHAINGEWQQSHLIAQESSDPIACWVHAVLHKLEGDEGNSRYWYAQSGAHHYEDHADPTAELRSIAELLNGSDANTQHR